MNASLILPSLLYIVASCAVLMTVMYWVYLWQLKEYRIDRMRDFFQSRSGQSLLFNMWVFLFCVVLVAVLFMKQFNLASPTVVQLLVLTFFVLRIVRFILHPLFPSFTVKAISISSLTGASLFCFFLFAHLFLSSTVSLLLVYVITPVVCSAIVLVFAPLTTIQKQRLMTQAAERIATLKPIVIGVTGSYGKTTTKEFLVALLNQRYTVCSTPKNVNTDIGVAQTIMKDLTPEHDVFVVEMGAYTIGEINAICDIVHPIIGIVTAVNEQHLALFGSIERIITAKSELITSLPTSGLAVLNADNPHCVTMSNNTDATVRFFSSTGLSQVYADHVVVGTKQLDAQVHIRDRSFPISAPLCGKQTIPSLLAAITVADHLGVSVTDMQRAITQLSPPPATMQLKKGINGVLVIDDSYNSNPDGFVAALDYLQLFDDKRRIVITPGMLELGTESDRLHRTVGARAAEVAELLIITKEDSLRSLTESSIAGGLPAQSVQLHTQPTRLIENVLSHCSADDVILLEGRVHQSIRTYLLAE